jgi:hypothetical protein
VIAPELFFGIAIGIGIGIEKNGNAGMFDTDPDSDDLNYGSASLSQRHWLFVVRTFYSFQCFCR